jgi:outer membrane biogenesis lipoprotein LolB
MKRKTDFLIALLAALLLIGCSAEASLNQPPVQVNISQQQTNSNAAQGGAVENHAQQGLVPLQLGNGAR